VRVLTVAAHPDDETLGAGGTMARLAAQGHEVWICILTDGVTARHAHVEQQKECAIGAADVLGAANVVFCELPDQRLDSLPLLDVITPIEKCIGELQPEIVFTHFKEDVNQDHRTVFQATMVAARPVEGTSVRQLLCYETASSTEWAPPSRAASSVPTCSSTSAHAAAQAGGDALLRAHLDRRDAAIPAPAFLRGDRGLRPAPRRGRRRRGGRAVHARPPGAPRGGLVH
jgi:LmbE family N-acetylglucosaminyl deacetylase